MTGAQGRAGRRKGRRGDIEKKSKEIERERRRRVRAAVQHYEACHSMKARTFTSQCAIGNIIHNAVCTCTWFRYLLFLLSIVGVYTVYLSPCTSIMYARAHAHQQVFLCMFVQVCVYLLSCWAWHIRVHIHWRRLTSWWRLCGAEERREPHHTSLWTKKECEDPRREK